MRMRCAGLAAIVAFALTACEKKQEPTTHDEVAYQPPPDTEVGVPPGDPFAPDPFASEAPARDPYATDPMVNRESTASRPPATPVRNDEVTLIDDTRSGEQRVHVVHKGDTLYKLARTYYNDQSRWRDIWQANRASIPNKDRLSIGTRLVIPE
jgi:nucleoid-associated protein YgaU